MTIQVQPIVDEYRSLCNALAADNNLPVATIVSRMYRESRKLCERSMTAENLLEFVALGQLCHENGVH